MSKKVYKNPSPLELDIENIDGEVVTLVAKPMTPELTESLEGILADKKEDVSATHLVIKQMSLIFGKAEDFYNQFDYGLLNNILSDVSDEYKKKIMGNKVQKNSKS